MKLDLDKKDLINLVKGTTPYYSLFDLFTTDGLGVYCESKNGKVHDYWVWNEEKLKKMTENQLFELYQTCLNSYK